MRTPSAPRSDEALTHALESHIKTLQGDNEALKERLAEAEARFAAAETRIKNLLADLADQGAQHADERAVLVAQIAAEVARTIGVSLELLSEPERLRFGELGVFPDCATLSSKVGMPSILCEPSAFGMYARRTGGAR